VSNHKGARSEGARAVWWRGQVAGRAMSVTEMSPVDKLIEFCNSPPTPVEGNTSETDAMREFVQLARAATRSRLDVSPLLQKWVGWVGEGIKPGQSISPQVLLTLSSSLMTLPDDPPGGLARMRSMPSGVQLPTGAAGRGLSLALTPEQANQSQFVSTEERERQADRLHKAQVAVRHCLNMPTEEQATKRRAENIEHKLYAEAMSHAQDDNGRKNFYEQKLQEIYKKMHLLVKSHQDKGPGALPGGAAAGPFVSLASNGLNPQGSFTGPLPAQGSAGQRPLAALPATTAVATQPQGDSKQPPNAPGDAAAAPAGASGGGASGGASGGGASGGGSRGGSRGASGSESEQDIAQYWKRLDKLRPHRNFAMRYIQTLDKFTDKTMQDIAKTSDEEHKKTLTKKRKVAENVRKYLWLLCRLCNDDPGRGGRQMPPNLRLLDVIHKTLEAVYKRQRMPDASANNKRLNAQMAGKRTHRTQYTQGAALINTGSQNPNGLKFDYDVDALNWNEDHRRNAENRYCYCGTDKQEPCVQCTVCKQWFHKSCTTDVVPKDGKGWVEFQVNYRFTCKICCSADNQERFELTKCSWLESILGGFQNLMYTQQRDMFKAAEITAHLDMHWDALCHQRDRGDNKKWRNSLNSYLTNNMKKFDRPKKFFWALANPKNDPYGPAVQPCKLFKSSVRNEPPADTGPKPKKRQKPPKQAASGVDGMVPGAQSAQPIDSFSVGDEHQPWDTTGVDNAPFDPTLSGMSNMATPWDSGAFASPPSGGFEMDIAPWDQEGMSFGTDSGVLMSTSSYGDGVDEGMPVAGAPLVEEEDTAQCPKCNLGTRNFGSAERNQYICVKCDQDEHKKDMPDLNKAKIPNNVVVWNAEVTVGDDPVPYKVTICDSCRTDVQQAGHLVWEAKSTQIAVNKFRQEQYEDPTEEWVECEFCNSWYHQVCVRFDKQIYGDNLPPVCPNEACRLKRDIKYPSVLDLNHTSADLKASTLSKFLEERIETEVFAETERSGNHGVTVRVVTNVARSVNFKEVAGKIGGRYKREEKELPYKQKNIFAFYRCPDGAEIAFFALQVQEYGADCPAPNTNTAYISYLDSNQLYHCPGCGAHDDIIGRDTWTDPGGAPSLCTMPEDCKRERRQLYDTLFVGYMEYLKRRGLHRAYIWVMPPETAESDYVFYYRPRDMHLPSAEALEKWYIRVLEKAQDRGAIDFFEDNTGRRDKNQGQKRKKSVRRNAGFLFQPPTPRTKDESGDDDDSQPAKRQKGGDSPHSSAGAASDDTTPSLSHMPIFKGDHMAGVIEHVLSETEKKETGSRKTSNSARSQKEAETSAGASDRPGFGRTLSKSLVDEVTHYMTDETQGSYIRCHFEAASNESFTPDLEDDPIISIDADSQGASRNNYRLACCRCLLCCTLLLCSIFTVVFAPQVR
jgi:uncharacterized membrane protein YgcG